MNLPPPEISNQNTVTYPTTEPTEPQGDAIDPALLVNGKIPAGMQFQKSTWTRCEYTEANDGDPYVTLANGCQVYVTWLTCWEVTEIRWIIAPSSPRVSYKEVQLSRKTAYVVNCPDGRIGLVNWTPAGDWPPPNVLGKPIVQEAQSTTIGGKAVIRRTETYRKLVPPAKIVPPCTIEAQYINVRLTTVVGVPGGEVIEGPDEEESGTPITERWTVPNCAEQLTPKMLGTPATNSGGD